MRDTKDSLRVKSIPIEFLDDFLKVINVLTFQSLFEPKTKYLINFFLLNMKFINQSILLFCPRVQLIPSGAAVGI